MGRNAFSSPSVQTTGVGKAAEALGASVPSTVWQTLFTLVPTTRGPLAIQHAPLLATGPLGPSGLPWSSILYPAGMRAALMASHEGLADRFRIDARGGAQPDDGPLTRLNRDVARFADLDRIRQAQVLACLNCLTEQRVAVLLAPHLTTEHFTDSAGGHVVYEMARALIRSRPADPQSRTALWRLVTNPPDAALGAAAAVQLGAASVRIDDDLAMAAAALEAADRWRNELDRGMAAVLALLVDSRYYRLSALVALKRKDFMATERAMHGARETAEAALASTADSEPYPSLVAQENYKIVLESHLKAASGSQDTKRFAQWAAKLLALDSEDPYTWRYIATYGARCGLVTEAAFALAGLTAMGGLGTMEVIGALRHAPAHSERDPQLGDVLLAALHELHRPGQR